MYSALLQHSCNRNFTLSFTSASPRWPITPLLTPASFPTCALKSPKRIIDSLVVILRRATHNSSTNAGDSALEFVTYTCSKHGSNSFNSTYIPFLLLGSIHQHNLPSEGPQVSPLQPGKLCWLNAWVGEFPPIVHLNSVKITTLSRSDAKTSKEYWLASSASSCCFPVSEVVFRFWITGFQIPQSRSILRCPHSTPQMQNVRNVGPPVVDNWWERLSRTLRTW